MYTVPWRLGVTMVATCQSQSSQSLKQWDHNIMNIMLYRRRLKTIDLDHKVIRKLLTEVKKKKKIKWEIGSFSHGHLYNRLATSGLAPCWPLEKFQACSSALASLFRPGSYVIYAFLLHSLCFLCFSHNKTIRFFVVVNSVMWYLNEQRKNSQRSEDLFLLFT